MQIPSEDWWIWWPYGSSILVFDTSQLGSQGGGQFAASLEDLSVSSLTTLRWAIDNAAAQSGVPSTELGATLEFAGGALAHHSLAGIRAQIEESISSKRLSGEVYDVNSDGLIDLWDLSDFLDIELVASAGESWPANADINADGQLDVEDECEITTVVLNEL